MFHESFRRLFWREFKSIKQGADYFHVTKPTVVRWLDGTRRLVVSSALRNWKVLCSGVTNIVS